MRRILLEISILLTLTWMSRCQASTTVPAINPFNAEEDADKIAAAIRGLGTDEQAIVDILTKRSCKQREDIRKARDEKWLSDIKEDFLLDEDALTVIISSMYCGPALYRYYFKRAFDDEDAAAVAEMLSTLSHQSENWLEIVQKEYFEAEQETFEGAMTKAFDGDFLHWCSEIIMAKRDCAGAVDQPLADKEAAALLASMPSWKTDRTKLNQVLMKPSVMQVRTILTKFKELNKQTDLATAITEMQLDDKDMVLAYMYLIHDLNDEFSFIVSRLKDLTDAGDGLGLSRLILCRSEIELLEAKQVYQDRYSIPLSMKIKDIAANTQLSLLLGFLGETYSNTSAAPGPAPSPASPPPK